MYFRGLSAVPPTQLGDSFWDFFDGLGDCRQNFISRIRGFRCHLSPGATVLSNDDNFIDFGGFEVFVNFKETSKKYK